ncbi:Hypothetical predicted protein [Mytilus galloprovincialis]|uniref:Uncharacterized protein n=1 Tax=Mytilus galloprovincialis TaxID=29158 RepID=A0A8B6CW38_MYTGA|nr:Hypothetical predicted protein [Mytilus galloprovincialis]
MSCLFGKDDASKSGSDNEYIKFHTRDEFDQCEERPMTCQIYPGLSATRLYNYLKSKSASTPCIIYYLRRLQTLNSNYKREYLERNGVPYPYNNIFRPSLNVSNNASTAVSTDWMSIISHDTSISMNENSLYYKLYYGSQDF